MLQDKIDLKCIQQYCGWIKRRKTLLWCTGVVRQYVERLYGVCYCGVRVW